MAIVYDITTRNNALTATITDDSGSWSWSITNPTPASSGTLPANFSFLAAFSLGNNGQWAFGAGSEPTPGNYTGILTYAGADTQTNWMANKRGSVRKHDAA